MKNPAEDSQETPSERPAKRVHCFRLKDALEVSEHCRCLYCFGDEEKVEDGHHQEFCDYEPGRDPVIYGFPGAFGRYAADRGEE